jgi:hypothetical protein
MDRATLKTVLEALACLREESNERTRCLVEERASSRTLEHEMGLAQGLDMAKAAVESLTDRKTNPILIRFDDTAYRVARGSSPMGKGAWAFALEPNADPVWFSRGGVTLTEAKRDARIHFSEMLEDVCMTDRCVVLHVLP